VRTFTTRPGFARRRCRWKAGRRAATLLLGVILTAVAVGCRPVDAARRCADTEGRPSTVARGHDRAEFVMVPDRVVGTYLHAPWGAPAIAHATALEMRDLVAAGSSPRDALACIQARFTDYRLLLLAGRRLRVEFIGDLAIDDSHRVAELDY
jgi:hypothetical protein